MSDSDTSTSSSTSSAQGASANSSVSTCSVGDLQLAVDSRKFVDYSDEIRTLPPSAADALKIKASSLRFGKVLEQCKKRAMVLSGFCLQSKGVDVLRWKLMAGTIDFVPITDGDDVLISEEDANKVKKKEDIPADWRRWSVWSSLSGEYCYFQLEAVRVVDLREQKQAFRRVSSSSASSSSASSKDKSSKSSRSGAKDKSSKSSKSGAKDKDKSSKGAKDTPSSDDEPDCNDGEHIWGHSGMFPCAKCIKGRCVICRKVAPEGTVIADGMIAREKCVCVADLSTQRHAGVAIGSRMAESAKAVVASAREAGRIASDAVDPNLPIPSGAVGGTTDHQSRSAVPRFSLVRPPSSSSTLPPRPPVPTSLSLSLSASSPALPVSSSVASVHSLADQLLEFVPPPPSASAGAASASAKDHSGFGDGIFEGPPWIPFGVSSVPSGATASSARHPLESPPAPPLGTDTHAASSPSSIFTPFVCKMGASPSPPRRSSARSSGKAASAHSVAAESDAEEEEEEEEEVQEVAPIITLKSGGYTQDEVDKEPDEGSGPLPGMPPYPKNYKYLGPVPFTLPLPLRTKISALFNEQAHLTRRWEKDDDSRPIGEQLTLSMELGDAEQSALCPMVADLLACIWPSLSECTPPFGISSARWVRHEKVGETCNAIDSRRNAWATTRHLTIRVNLQHVDGQHPFLNFVEPVSLSADGRNYTLRPGGPASHHEVRDAMYYNNFIGGTPRWGHDQLAGHTTGIQGWEFLEGALAHELLVYLALTNDRVPSIPRQLKRLFSGVSIERKEIADWIFTEKKRKFPDIVTLFETLFTTELISRRLWVQYDLEPIVSTRTPPRLLFLIEDTVITFPPRPFLAPGDVCLLLSFNSTTVDLKQKAMPKGAPRRRPLRDTTTNTAAKKRKGKVAKQGAGGDDSDPDEDELTRLREEVSALKGEIAVQNVTIEGNREMGLSHQRIEAALQVSLTFEQSRTTALRTSNTHLSQTLTSVELTSSHRATTISDMLTASTSKDARITSLEAEKAASGRVHLELTARASKAEGQVTTLRETNASLYAQVHAAAADATRAHSSSEKAHEHTRSAATFAQQCAPAFHQAALQTALSGAIAIASADKDAKRAALPTPTPLLVEAHPTSVPPSAPPSPAVDPLKAAPGGIESRLLSHGSIQAGVELPRAPFSGGTL
jgi:hypothetical protein